MDGANQGRCTAFEAVWIRVNILVISATLCNYLIAHIIKQYFCVGTTSAISISSNPLKEMYTMKKIIASLIATVAFAGFAFATEAPKADAPKADAPAAAEKAPAKKVKKAKKAKKADAKKDAAAPAADAAAPAAPAAPAKK
jgi:hypothetical protein